MEIKHIIREWALDESFLHNRMSFICGPRQVGKTTLVRNFLKEIQQSGHYYNWDSISLKQKFAANPLFFIEDIAMPLSADTRLPPGKRLWVVFDEIHKYPKWKNILKGYYDEWEKSINFVIMGSARLDYFRRSGDSLVGRYFLFKMTPLHPHDLTSFVPNRDAAWHPKASPIPFGEPDISFQSAAEHLYNISGFPEPASVGTKEFYERWKHNHISLITSEDVRDLSKITNIQKLQTLAFLLPERVGSPLSLNSLKNILECAHASVQNWLEVLKKVYLVFDVAPYSFRVARSVLKERKYYFWDWGLLEDQGKRFENFVAVQLRRAVAAWTEWGKGDYKLTFIRTKDGREVDFVITEKDAPCLLIECRRNDRNVSPNLSYFKNMMKVPLAFQVVGGSSYLKQVESGIFVVDLDRFLRMLV